MQLTLLSSPMLFTLQNISLTYHSILTNYSLLQSHKISELSSIKTSIILLPSGIALAVPNELITWLLIKRQNNNCILDFLCKPSWDFSKKEKCNSIIQKWQMYFQASDCNLNLLDNNYLSIKPTYMKDSTWLKLLGHLNSLYARATRAITNHAPIGKYCLRFFPRENSNCLCKIYPIKSRHHILYKCRRYNNLLESWYGVFELFCHIPWITDFFIKKRYYIIYS